MTPEQNRRVSAVKLADAINKMESVPITAQAQKLSYQWARGEITGEQMKAAIINLHKRPVKKDLYSRASAMEINANR